MNIFVKAFVETTKQWMFYGIVACCIFLPPILISNGYFYSGVIVFLLEFFCASYYSVYSELKGKE
jgi:hypothetical protein